MLEDPNIIRLGIRHLEALLRLGNIEESRERITGLLEQAQAQLAAAEAAQEVVAKLAPERR